MKNLKLVIFDCDGVLVDSEKTSNSVLIRILNDEYGTNLTLNDAYETFVGRSTKTCISIIEAMIQQQLPDSFEAYYNEEVYQALASSVLPIEGIEYALNQINTPFCVASSGSHQKMGITLNKTKLMPYFEDHIYSSTEVSRGKPYPDIFLHAAKHMGGISPINTLVIEDSQVGVTAAKAAGMWAFGYCKSSPKKALVDAGADQVFDNMSNLPLLIEAFFSQN